MNVYVVNQSSEFKPLGTGQGQELNVQDSVVQAAALPDRASHARVSVKTNNVLMTYDGTNPATNGAGILLTAGTVRDFNRYELSRAKFIRAESAKNAVLRIEPGLF